MRQTNRFEDIDRGALKDALLALRTCPVCRGDLQPVAFLEDVYGCGTCKETHYLSKEGK